MPNGLSNPLQIMLDQGQSFIRPGNMVVIKVTNNWHQPLLFDDDTANLRVTNLNTGNAVQIFKNPVQTYLNPGESISITIQVQEPGRHRAYVYSVTPPPGITSQFEFDVSFS